MAFDAVRAGNFEAGACDLAPVETGHSQIPFVSERLKGLQVTSPQKHTEAEVNLSVLLRIVKRSMQVFNVVTKESHQLDV